MKKKSKIRILKDNQKNDDSYTFILYNIGLSYTHNANTSIKSKEGEDDTGLADVTDDLNEVRKKKKVLTNEDARKASKGLKFNNPSQRNHSSVYE